VKDRIGGFEQHVLEKVKVTPAPDALTRLREVVDACFFHATVSNHRRFIMTLMIEALDTNPRLSAEFPRHPARMRTFFDDRHSARPAEGHAARRGGAGGGGAVIMGGIIGRGSALPGPGGDRSPAGPRHAGSSR